MERNCAKRRLAVGQGFSILRSSQSEPWLLIPAPSFIFLTAPKASSYIGGILFGNFAACLALLGGIDHGASVLFCRNSYGPRIAELCLRH